MAKKRRDKSLSTEESTQSAPVALPRWVLPALIALYVLLTSGLIARIPPGATPDEIEHLRYVQYVAQEHRLPFFERQDKVNAGGNGPGFEYHQPPLYYVACAPLVALLPTNAEVYACRFVSLLCGALCLLLIWRSARALWPRDETLAALATGFAALWPLHQGIGASANNDAMAGLMAAAIFHQVAQIGARGWRRRDALTLAIFSALGLLAKSTGLVLVLIALCASFYFAGLRNANSRDSSVLGGKRRRVEAVFVCAVALLLLCGPYFARNHMLYGDVLALGAISERFQNIGSRTRNFSAGGVSLDTYLRALVLILFSTAWGFFGGPNTALTMLNPFGTRGPWRLFAMGSGAVGATIIAILVCVAATALAGVGLPRAARLWPAIPTHKRAVLVLWMFGAILVFAAWVHFNLTYFQAQARYLHPALLPLTVGCAVGWLQVLGRGRALQLGALAVGLTLLGLTLWNIFGWRTLV